MFNEKTHAYVIGSYYKYLEQLKEVQGKAIFVKGAQRYAEQRGNRMALRALRDGLPLDYSTYFAYGEWTPTVAAKSEDVGQNGERRSHIFKCAWAESFAEMGQKACGQCYCYEIDRGIVRGFNPDLQFKTHQNLSDSDFCDLQFIGSDKTKVVPPPSDGKKDWAYHTAHALKTFGEVCFVALRNAHVMGQVQEDFAHKYGEDNLITLVELMQQDFNKI